MKDIFMSESDELDFELHDFGVRGVTNYESGIAYLMGFIKNFEGTYVERTK